MAKKCKMAEFDFSPVITSYLSGEKDTNLLISENVSQFLLKRLQEDLKKIRMAEI
jgi:hypothetical protein